jgi:hypothetical protein
VKPGYSELLPGVSGKSGIFGKIFGIFGHFSGIFGKSRISGKFPGISEASLDSTCHLGAKAITFYSGLRIR